MYTAVVVLVPLNVLLAMLYPERGARYRAAWRWLLLLGAEGLLLAWLSTTGWTFLVPLAGRLMFATMKPTRG